MKVAIRWKLTSDMLFFAASRVKMKLQPGTIYFIDKVKASKACLYLAVLDIFR